MESEIQLAIFCIYISIMLVEKRVRKYIEGILGIKIEESKK